MMCTKTSTTYINEIVAIGTLLQTLQQDLSIYMTRVDEGDTTMTHYKRTVLSHVDNGLSPVIDSKINTALKCELTKKL